jgi:2,3-diaminopropionate biosynthesis protein SbnB
MGESTGATRLHTTVNVTSAGQHMREASTPHSPDGEMTKRRYAPCFHIVSGRTVRETIFSSIEDIVQIVEATYRAHARGTTVVPPSSFLKFPRRDGNRIIALPAHLEDVGGVSTSGIKWISSFPANVAQGLPRASGALILNDAETGFPLVCLEASVISAARTAASAVLAARCLNGQQRGVSSLGVVGAGFIARYIVEFFLKAGWHFEQLQVHDIDRAAAGKFARRFQAGFRGGVVLQEDAPSVMRASDLVVFATTAGRPYVSELASLAHNPIVLHISLRDLSPDIILAAHNVVDDIDHCLSANTSTHLAEQKSQNRNFVGFTLPHILCGVAPPDRSRPIIFSPFGLGILDIAVGRHVFETAKAAGTVAQIPEFFGDVTHD